MRKIALCCFLIGGVMQARLSHDLFALETQETKESRQALWDKDVQTLQKIIALWSAGVGPDSLGVAQYKAKLGSALIHTGDYAGAEQALRSALSILQANGPQYDAAAILVQRRLALALKDQNKTDEAAQLVNSLPPVHHQAKNDTPPTLISKVDPDYTDAARDQSVSGFISVSVTVDETGHPTDIHIIEPLGFGLDESAIKAVSKWKFKPALRNGAPVSAEATLGVTFAKLS
jgi:TonB family protein